MISFWKFGLCLAIVAVALSEQKPLEDQVKETVEVELGNVLPGLVKNIFPKEELRELVNTFKGVKKDEVIIVNDDVDKLLVKLNNHIIMSGLDPTKLENQGFEFEWKILLIKYTGEMTLKDGWLQGLATLERVKDCTVTSNGEKLTLVLPLTFTDLLFNYRYAAKFMGLGPRGGVDGKITDSKFTITVDVDIVTLQAELESFKLNKAGKMSLKFTGHVLVDWMINIFSSVTITFLSPILRIFVSGWVESGALAIIELYNESVCSIVGTCL